MISPWPPVGPILFPEALVFGLMILGNLYVLRRLFPASGKRSTLADMTFALGLLGMALGLWGALVYAAVDPGQASEISVFIAANSMMAVFGCWLIAVFYRAERMHPRAGGWGWPSLLAGLMIGNEFLMGLAYLLLSQGPAMFSVLGWAGLELAVGAAASSAWFYFAMLVNMLAFAFLLSEGPRTRRLLLAFALSAAVGPWLVSDPELGGIGMGALMAYAAVDLVSARRAGSLSVGYLRTLFVVWTGFTLMSIGEVAYVTLPSSIDGLLVLGLASLAAMALELAVLTRRGLARAVDHPMSEPPGPERLPQSMGPTDGRSAARTTDIAP